MNCSACGASNAANFVYCAACGTKRVIDMSGGTAASARTGTVLAQATPAAPTTPVTPFMHSGKATMATHPYSRQPQGSPVFAKDATRYLCAAVHTDSQLNKLVIRALIDDEHRAVAFSPGVDLSTVLKHALAARRRLRIRDALLALQAILAIPLLGAPLLTAWLTVYVERWHTYHKVLMPHLRREVFDRNTAPQPMSAAHRARADQIATMSREENVIVSNGYNPFTGFGVADTDWSFALTVDAAAPGEIVKPFTIHELYDRVEHNVSALGLPGVSVTSRVLVNGDDLRAFLDPADARVLLPDPFRPPVWHVDDSYVRKLREEPGNRARSYLVIRVTGWSGEIVATLFLRFVMLPKRDLLFVELSRSLLAPYRDEFHDVDRVASANHLLRRSLAMTLPTLLQSLVNTAQTLMRPLTLSRQRQENEKAIRDGSFAYGPTIIPRELAASRMYHRYFQRVDRQMYVKLVEQELFDVLADFLEEHGISSDDLRARVSIIQNNGIMVTGGQLNAGAVSAGTMSRAMNAVKQSAPASVPMGRS